MKRDLSNVTKDHIIRLKKWIKEDFESANDGNYCPFVGNQKRCSSEICYEVFPGLVDGVCPCRHFRLEYVKEVARKIIKELS